MCEGMKGRFHTNLDDLKRFLLTKRHARGTPGSTGTSSPRCATPKKPKKMQINANIFVALHLQKLQISQLCGTDLGLAVSLACWKA